VWVAPSAIATSLHIVIPAQAGIHPSTGNAIPVWHDQRYTRDTLRRASRWIPAFAGMQEFFGDRLLRNDRDRDEASDEIAVACENTPRGWRNLAGRIWWFAMAVLLHPRGLL
jgi:hypothetical protein